MRIVRRLTTALVEAVKRPLHVDSDQDPYHLAFADFFARVNRLEAPRVLELGARARSGHTYRQRLAPGARYTGLDVALGPNVDVVADAHRLDALFRPRSFDAVFSISVFEHLAFPWQVALAINEVLRPGGLAFVATHPTYPPHDLPWDFFRFQPGAMRALFGPAAGFELVACAQGLPCRIVPLASDPPLRGLWRQTAYLGIAALARKVGAPQPISARALMEAPYPF